jgi:hypothetical protein
MNFHILWPGRGPYKELGKALLRSKAIRGDCRIRLLNFISGAPVDCPVAVIFGHACAMNWAGPGFDDVGMELADAFWRAGYYADLLPTSEVKGKSLQVDDQGNVWFGRQRYAAVVLYHPEFENAATAAFFQKAATGKTILYRVGGWTKNFDAHPFNGKAALPKQMKEVSAIPSCADAVISNLRHRGIAPQTLATVTFPKWGGRGRTSAALPSSGRSRLTDGTMVIVSGENDPTGDPIHQTITVANHEVRFDALGIAAVRLDRDGRLEAMAAGGLKFFSVGGISIDLPERADVALWRDGQGKMRGVLQDWKGPVPAALATLTASWLRLAVPTPPAD